MIMLMSVASMPCSKKSNESKSVKEDAKAAFLGLCSRMEKGKR